MSLIVPGVVRFNINQSMGGRVVVNIIDMFMETTGSTADRAGAINDQAGVLINQWRGDLQSTSDDSLVFNSVSWVDLDSAGGSVGSRVQSGAITLPLGGTGVGDPIPPNTAMLVTKQINGGRLRRNGRMYMAGQRESVTEPTNGGLFTTAWVTTVNTALANFLGNINQTVTGVFTYTSAMSVVSITGRDADGNPTTGVHSVVTALVAQRLAATQRRRLRG
jgi:hypothetical protein